jgi:hypothetical protein
VNQQDVEKAILDIQERNSRVEADKAWETSLTRKIIISAMTYIVVLLVLLAAGAPRPYMGAAVPSAGFLLSTLSLPLFKKHWIDFHKK